MCCGKIVGHNEKKEVTQTDKTAVAVKPQIPAKKKNYNSVKPKFGYTS